MYTHVTERCRSAMYLLLSRTAGPYYRQSCASSCPKFRLPPAPYRPVPGQSVEYNRPIIGSVTQMTDIRKSRGWYDGGPAAH